MGSFPLRSWVISNYAIKPTPEQALRTNRAMPPARLIAALEITRIAVIELVKREKAGDEYFDVEVPGVGGKVGMEVEA